MTVPHTNRPARTAAALAAATVLALGAAGCTGKDKADDTQKAAAKASAGVPTISTPPLPPEPTFSATPVGAVVDAKVVECKTDAGEQTAKLTLTNSSKTARDYAVMVIWLKNDSGTPLGSGLKTVQNLEPGKKVDIEVKAKVMAKADKCALNVRAGDLK